MNGSNFTWLHTFYCLLLWDHRESVPGTKRRLYGLMMEAANEGLVPKDSIQFLNSEVRGRPFFVQIYKSQQYLDFTGPFDF